MAETPRDETAFSVDPFTGAPIAPLKVVETATEAMVKLHEGELDEAGYNAAVAPAEEPEPEVQAPSNSGDEVPPEAPESDPAEPTSKKS